MDASEGNGNDHIIKSVQLANQMISNSSKQPEKSKKILSSKKSENHPSAASQIPKVYGKDKQILQIKMHDIQKPSQASISSSAEANSLADHTQLSEQREEPQKKL